MEHLTVDNLPVTQDIDDDPYQVYMLRRPHERASSVVPQLPKHPEMADTRLRYRRIAPEARSGSFGSLGNHFPARFHFPNRRSMLESLTSDDEASSFALCRKRRDRNGVKKGRRRKVRPNREVVTALHPLRDEPSWASLSDEEADRVCHLVSVPEFLDINACNVPVNCFPVCPSSDNSSRPINMPPIVLPSGHTVEHVVVHQSASASSSSTPISTSPTTPVPGSPINPESLLTVDNTDPLLSDMSTQGQQVTSLPLSQPSPSMDCFCNQNNDISSTARPDLDLLAKPTNITRKTFLRVPGTADLAFRSAENVEHLGRKKSARKKSNHLLDNENELEITTKDASCPRKMLSGHRLLGRKNLARSVGWRGDGVKASKQTKSKKEGSAVATVRLSNDGRPIRAPQAMSPEMRQKFVLHVEQPEQYQAKGETIRRGKRKRKKRLEKEFTVASPPPPSTTKEYRANCFNEEGWLQNERNRTGQMAEGCEDIFHRGAGSRDKDLSVSFAHRRYTVEEAAVKPLSAIQRLWHVLASARMGTRRRTWRR